MSLAATAVLAEPFVVVDGSETAVIFLDEDLQRRDDDRVEVRVLFAMRDRRPLLNGLVVDCRGQTYQSQYRQEVLPDATAGPRQADNGEVYPVHAGSLIGSVVAKACRGEQTNDSAGARFGSLAQAVNASRVYLETPSAR
ncbi:hypothetical protein [Brevundimonas sp.]|uniref:hypothetical protein n=1 Tax=Brevundimonas sp. TaxID=1871086 RepID=UPI002AB92FCA|nr:hypothetical protein [Brevundimonas sp.]MDZ4365323.1 hypothetical protein [Brevundimonas sp.]